MQQKKTYDIFIIGGGINGCGLARDAAGRGYKVGLAEMKDLAAATSSASTKLIHGGLRYLEHYAFLLVREALIEREIILRNAPHLVHPLRFLLTYNKQRRPFWLLRLGLFLYDHLAHRKAFLSTRTIDFTRQYANILKPDYKKGFEYSDASVDDARLVVANARHAAKLGADILVGWRLEQAQRLKDHWELTLRYDDGTQKTVTSRYLVNAAGPYVQQILHNVIKAPQQESLRLVKGSHIVVPAIFNHDRAYIFQNDDGRIVFAIPYQEKFTLIGTTDIDYQGDPLSAKIEEAEISYLCQAVNQYFAKSVTEDMVVWSYSGVRPLYNDGASKAQEATRDYVLKESSLSGEAGLLNIYGGKITTYRKLSEDALKLIEEKLGHFTSNWTANVPLPGGDFGYKNLAALQQRLADIRPEFSPATIHRLIRAYGTEALEIFACYKDKGQHFGHEFYEIELLWMIENEWARHSEDVLWRRSKLGLYFSEIEKEKIANYIASYYEKHTIS